MEYVKDADLALSGQSFLCPLADADYETFLELALTEAGAVIDHGQSEAFPSELFSDVQLLSPITLLRISRTVNS